MFISAVLFALTLKKCIASQADRKPKAHFTAATLIFYTLQNTLTATLFGVSVNILYCEVVEHNLPARNIILKLVSLYMHACNLEQRMGVVISYYESYTFLSHLYSAA